MFCYGTPTTTPLMPLNICTCFNWSASSSGQTSCESCATAWGFCRLCVPNWGVAPALRALGVLTHGTSRTTADKTRIWNCVPDDAPQPGFPISLCVHWWRSKRDLGYTGTPKPCLIDGDKTALLKTLVFSSEHNRVFGPSILSLFFNFFHHFVNLLLKAE